MATANVVATFIEQGQVCMAVSISENGKNVEYIGRVKLDAEFQALSGPEKKAALIAAVKVVRDAQVETKPSAPSIAGTVTV